MFKFLLNTDNSFYESFESASQNVMNCAKTLLETLQQYPKELQIKATQIKEIEHKGDKITHETIEKLNTTFMTPLDREDIHQLITNMDDIVDLMDGAVSRLALYQIPTVTKEAVSFAEVLVKSTELLDKTITGLRHIDKREAIIPNCHEIHTMENVGDQLLRTAMVDLFETEKNNPINVIKWKEIYEDLEAATDRCEDVANIIEGIILKNA
ncbi:MAG: DUF47 domain-containing protein [Planctomycetes bacterium]|nr:DUF47 domain-containing protein [Planctomycetota bacterium]